jgi:hypothetical protein
VPVILLVIVSGPIQRWIASLCVATTLLNAAVVAAVLQSGHIPQLKLPSVLREKNISAVKTEEDAPVSR